MGNTAADCARALTDAGASAVGANCGEIDPAQMADARKYGALESLQPPWSLFWRHVEKEIVPVLRELQHERRRQLEVETLCTNRDLPLHLSLGQGRFLHRKTDGGVMAFYKRTDDI